MKKLKYSEAEKMLMEFLGEKYPEFIKHPEVRAIVSHFLQSPQIRPPFMSREIHEDSLGFVAQVLCKKSKEWRDLPYIDYLNAVDSILEKRSDTTSLQEELSFIADFQEMNIHPNETADEVLKGRK